MYFSSMNRNLYIQSSDSPQSTQEGTGFVYIWCFSLVPYSTYSFLNRDTRLHFTFNLVNVQVTGFTIKIGWYREHGTETFSVNMSLSFSQISKILLSSLLFWKGPKPLFFSIGLPYLGGMCLRLKQDQEFSTWHRRSLQFPLSVNVDHSLRIFSYQ